MYGDLVKIRLFVFGKISFYVWLKRLLFIYNGIGSYCIFFIYYFYLEVGK